MILLVVSILFSLVGTFVCCYGIRRATHPDETVDTGWRNHVWWWIVFVAGMVAFQMGTLAVKTATQLSGLE